MATKSEPSRRPVNASAPFVALASMNRGLIFRSFDRYAFAFGLSDTGASGYYELTLNGVRIVNSTSLGRVVVTFTPDLILEPSASPTEAPTASYASACLAARSPHWTTCHRRRAHGKACLTTVLLLWSHTALA